MIKKLLPSLAVVSTLLFLTSCQQEGPAEKMGKKVDETVETVKESFIETEGPAEKMGKKVDATVEDVKESFSETKEDIRDRHEKLREHSEEELEYEN